MSDPIRYLSLFSGIEAMSVAVEPLGWVPVAFAEIEPFPCAVLKHHWPHVPNLGDITKITEEQIKALGPIDLVVAGSPCTDLSQAGKRKGMYDEHGNVTRSGLFYASERIFRWSRARWYLWENVFGAFSSNKGADFGSVVETLVGARFPVPPKGWGQEGMARGPGGFLEFATLDSQWRGLAQRRVRVFAVLDTGDWSSRPPILLESPSLRGDTPPSRGTRQDVAQEAGDGSQESGLRTASHWDGDYPHPTLSLNGSGGIGASNQEIFSQRGACLVPADAQVFGGNKQSGEQEVAAAPNPKGGSGRMDFETESFVVTSVMGDITHILKAEGFDGSEDGTGRGVPVVSYSAQLRGREGGSALELELELHPALRASQGGGDKPMVFQTRGSNLHVDDDITGTLGSNSDRASGGAPVVAYALQAGVTRENPSSGPDGLGVQEELAYTPEARAEVQITAFNARQDPISSPFHTGPLDTKGDTQALQYHDVVRRLTPTECARLQGFPDDHCRIPWRGKPASECPDGPAYKAYGNSMSVPVMRYIAEQIEAAHIFRG